MQVANMDWAEISTNNCNEGLYYHTTASQVRLKRVEKCYKKELAALAAPKLLKGRKPSHKRPHWAEALENHDAARENNRCRAKNVFKKSEDLPRSRSQR